MQIRQTEYNLKSNKHSIHNKQLYNFQPGNFSKYDQSKNLTLRQSWHNFPPNKTNNNEHKLSQKKIEQQQQQPKTSQEISSWLAELPPQFEVKDYAEVRGKILEIAVHPSGQKILQKLFVNSTTSELDEIIQELKNNFYSLMIDSQTSFLFQALSQTCTPEQRLLIFKTLGNKIVDLACDKKGTHPLQGLLALVTCEDEEDYLVDVIQKDTLKLILVYCFYLNAYIKHVNGSHFIQKVCQTFQKKRLDFVYTELIEHFIEIINHTSGVCIAKVIITRYKDDIDKIQKICSLATSNLELLIQNPYGNYAIQHILQYQQRCFKNYQACQYEEIIKKIQLKIIPFSNHKFSSNVVEKCLNETSAFYKKMLVTTICQDEIIIELLKNKFGNFVIKKAINVADQTEYELLINSLRNNIQLLNDSKFKMLWIQYIDEAQQQMYLKSYQNQFQQQF